MLNCVSGKPTLADVLVATETSMSVNVTWMMYQHGNHPPVTIDVYFKETGASSWILTGSHTATDNKIPMYQFIGDLTPNTPYNLLLIAINQHPSSNTTEYALTAHTRGVYSLQVYVHAVFA